MADTYNSGDGVFHFNDGKFKFLAVFEVVAHSEGPNGIRFLGAVRVRLGRNALAIASKRFPNVSDFHFAPPYKGRINRWRKRYPHKTLYKAPYPLNRAMCKKCGEVVESMSVHDYVGCSCGAMAVDGGYDYFRRVGDMRMIEEMP